MVRAIFGVGKDKVREMQVRPTLGQKNRIGLSTPFQRTIPNSQNFKTMATDLGGEWECWYHFLYWSVSKLTHPSGLGSHTYMQEVDEDAEIFRSIALALTMHYFLTDTVLSLLDLNTLRTRLEAVMQNVLTHVQS